jgi:hypothetical protein
MSHFWSSINRSTYIEPKRPFQAIGIAEFVAPFLIQSMTKPSFQSISSEKVKILLKNGTMKTENHYKNNYQLNSIEMKIIDAYDLNPEDNLNQAQTIFDMLTAGGYTWASNEMEEGELAPMSDILSIPNIQIIELTPHPHRPSPMVANPSLSEMAIDAVSDIINGEGIAVNLPDSARTSVNYAGQNAAGVWTIMKPIITSANFGSFNYGSTDFVTISLTLAYNNFKYEKI